jgi:hypothetical protein
VPLAELDLRGFGRFDSFSRSNRPSQRRAKFAGVFVSDALIVIAEVTTISALFEGFIRFPAAIVVDWIKSAGGFPLERQSGLCEMIPGAAIGAEVIALFVSEIVAH